MLRWTRIAWVPALALLLAAQTAQAGKLFLWEVESGSTRLYLLGSIHLAKPEIYPLDPTIEQAYESSSTLVVEADVDSINDPALQDLILQNGTFPDDQTLAGAISESTLEALQAYTEKRGLPLASFAGMRPWMVALSVSVIEMQLAGLSPEAGIDRHFLDRAREQRKPIEQLESAAEQIELLASIPEPLQERFLLMTLEEADRIPEILDRLIEAWGSGDTATIATLLLETTGQDEELRPIYEMLYLERNKKMAEKIRGYLAQPETRFVVVGAAHLVGEGGIIDLLTRQRDYSITQLTASAVAEPAVAGSD